MLKEEGGPVEAEQGPGHIDLKEELDVLVNRPTAVDAECHDQEVWREAVDCREKYIISLVRALRVVESRRRGSPDWDSLSGRPGRRFAGDVAQLTADLQQTLRNAEVELSIERARISRQESLIAQQRREIEKALKKQGITKPEHITSGRPTRPMAQIPQPGRRRRIRTSRFTFNRRNLGSRRGGGGRVCRVWWRDSVRGACAGGR